MLAEMNWRSSSLIWILCLVPCRQRWQEDDFSLCYINKNKGLFKLGVDTNKIKTELLFGVFVYLMVVQGGKEAAGSRGRHQNQHNTLQYQCLKRVNRHQEGRGQPHGP